MSILADVNLSITRAMKAHDAPTLSALRMLKTALTNKEVEKGRALEPAEELHVVPPSSSSGATRSISFRRAAASTSPRRSSSR
jgi:uncharacterized protein YqeY